MFSITIDPASGHAPYEQLRVQIRAGIRTRAIAPGSQLPTVRRLATELGLAPNTVARAYRELESEGILETRGRAGSFVAQSPASGTETLDLDALAQHYARTSFELGVEPVAALQLVAMRLGLTLPTPPTLP